MPGCGCRRRHRGQGVGDDGVVVDAQLVEHVEDALQAPVEFGVQVGVVVELAQPRSFVVEIHELDHVLGVAHWMPGPLDLGLGEVAVEVLGQDVEQLVVVLGHRLDRHILQTELLHEVEHLHVGVLVLERRVVDREPHDVVRVHQGDGEVPGFVAGAVLTQPVDRIAGDDRIEGPLHAEPVVHVVASKSRHPNDSMSGISSWVRWNLPRYAE